MDRRKTLVNEYKERKITGGIYRITNSVNGKYFLDWASNLRAKQNGFKFMVSSGTCFHFKLKGDWDSLGGNVFTFETLETIDKKADQTQEQFIDDLRTLEQMWSDKLDASKKY